MERSRNNPSPLSVDDFSDSPMFSNLSAVVSNKEVLTVSELNQALSQLVEATFPLLWISGEVSSFTRAASGHWYFTLKDDDSQIRAVMFRGRTRLVEFTPKLGDHIEVRATLSLYMARGEFQLNVESIRHAGAGNRYEAFLRMKARLEMEGVFDSGRKRRIPVFVKTVGLITSPQAAALRDVITTLARRVPHVQVILYPAPVQGTDAAVKIAEAIAVASDWAECDALIVCRGGGSLEDLWNFNEEPVARAIAACQIPVISGIGHETDFTIADFAADVRAPTPTGAAELVSRSRDDWVDVLASFAGQMTRLMDRHLQQAMLHTDMLSRRLVSPIAYIQRERLQLKALTVRLSLQQSDIRTMRYQLESRAERLASAMRNILSEQQQKVGSLSAQLELLNPQRILDRGYAIMQNEHGRIVRSPAEIPIKRPMSVRLAGGSADIVVDSVQPILS